MINILRWNYLHPWWWWNYLASTCRHYSSERYSLSGFKHMDQNNRFFSKPVYFFRKNDRLCANISVLTQNCKKSFCVRFCLLDPIQAMRISTYILSAVNKEKSYLLAIARCPHNSMTNQEVIIKVPETSLYLHVFFFLYLELSVEFPDAEYISIGTFSS